MIRFLHVFYEQKCSDADCSKGARAPPPPNLVFGTAASLTFLSYPYSCSFGALCPSGIRSSVNRKSRLIVHSSFEICFPQTLNCKFRKIRISIYADYFFTSPQRSTTYLFTQNIVIGDEMNCLFLVLKVEEVLRTRRLRVN